jgi:hypothetical protein
MVTTYIFFISQQHHAHGYKFAPAFINRERKCADCVSLIIVSVKIAKHHYIHCNAERVCDYMTTAGRGL